MQNDADGWDTEEFVFEEKKMNNPFFVDILELFLDHVIACVEQDSHGRGGFDSTRDLIEEYKDIKNWTYFCNVDDELDHDDELPFNLGGEFTYQVPRYQEGWFDSYYGYSIVYYDSDGDTYEVTYKK
jgi:hypothetical protein